MHELNGRSRRFNYGADLIIYIIRMEILVIASPIGKWKQHFKRAPRSHFCVTVDRKFHVAEEIFCHLAHENHIPNNVELHWVWSWSCWSCSSGISSFTRFNQKRIIKNFRIETNTRFIIQRRRQDFLAKFIRPGYRLAHQKSHIIQCNIMDIADRVTILNHAAQRHEDASHQGDVPYYSLD